MLSHKRQLLSLIIEDYDKLMVMDRWFKSIEEIPKIFAEGAFIIAFYYCLIVARKINGDGANRKTNPVILKRKR